MRPFCFWSFSRTAEIIVSVEEALHSQDRRTRPRFCLRQNHTGAALSVIIRWQDIHKHVDNQISQGGGFPRPPIGGMSGRPFPTRLIFHQGIYGTNIPLWDKFDNSVNFFDFPLFICSFCVKINILLKDN